MIGERQHTLGRVNVIIGLVGINLLSIYLVGIDMVSIVPVNINLLSICQY